MSPVKTILHIYSVFLLFVAALWPVMAKGSWGWHRHIFRRRDGAPSVRGKWADCIANFPATINLQYEIAGAELSRPKAAHYCFILLVSYYQQSQSTPTAPHTQSRFYITSIRRCTNAENIWRQPWELCFLRGWEGLFERRGPSAGPLCVCSLG